MRPKNFTAKSLSVASRSDDHVPGRTGRDRLGVERIKEKVRRRGVATVTLLVIAALLACLRFGENDLTDSDPRGTLLVSQAIIEHGTIRLDQYQAHFNNYKYHIREKNGHFYNYFPLGTALVSIPFVTLAKLFGADMAILGHEAKVQLIVAAVVLLLSFLVLERIGRIYLDPFSSAVLSATFLFGTSFVSTGMTALWSHNFAVLFALLAIFLLLHAKNTGQPLHWLLMTVFLFMGYLCRPTLLLLAPVVLVIQFIFVDRTSALKLALSLLLLAAAFIAFSLQEFHQLLPDYYLPERLQGGDFWRAAYCNLASPARGLFVYSPFLLPPVLAVAHLWKRYPEYRAEMSLALWPLLHLITISNFSQWWAGYSYGARLMYDALPALFVLLVIFWRGIDKGSNAARFTIVAAAFAVAVNFYQGIFNPYAGRWNSQPSIDFHQEFLFDWKYPQFLHNAYRHQRRIAEMQALNRIIVNTTKSTLDANKETVGNENIKAYLTDHRLSFGEQYSFSSKALIFFNWDVPEPDYRRSGRYYSEIAFMPDAVSLSSTAIRMELESIALQTIRVLVNGAAATTLTISPGAVSVILDVRGVLKPEAINLVQFELPESSHPSVLDPRMKSIALKSISLVRD